MNSTIDIIKKRTSLRRYADRPISKEHLDMIIESAMRAPTAGNMMLYSIIIVDDQAKKETLSRTCDNQPFIAKAPLVMVFVADYQKWFDYYQISGVGDYCREKNMEFEGANVNDFMLACCDALIAAQNAVIAAESLGIGSCYIGDIMENYETHKKLLNLPDWAFPVAMLCFGYYPEGYAKTRRNRFDEKYIVFNNEYKRLNEQELKDMYKVFEERFSTCNKFGAENMGQMYYAMKTGAGFSKEMLRSIKEALKVWDGRKL